MKAGYKGPLSLEIFNDGFRAAPTTITAADGHRSLLFLEEQTRALLDSEQQPAGELYESLAAPAHVGYQFLEFAVDHTTRASRRLARQTALSPARASIVRKT